MTPQKVVIKIPRKQGELIPFDLDKWNTGEYEAYHKSMGVARVLCIDNKGSYPIVVAYVDGNISSYTAKGMCYPFEVQPQLFLRKKSSEELPKDLFANVYNNDIGNRFDALYKADEASLSDRLALLHITYEWEDAV